MKREELIQQVAALLKSSFRSVKDQELRHYMVAEKIVTKIIEPAVAECEKQIVLLYSGRTSKFDS